ncbi:hypothetical protein GTP41_17605 [Pseudoduganella sp. DS3]|uniref:Uncharacterized protein n=1 Tax=Pseudoduganella guangdongensis TaxID=2692179 RepID=A0A6N9HL45_9BURK|nr:hypothetical protein [Pseudoduganella guangdongensis]MYN03913.1 hypothetical protein [Pseudoduganella guangdongensis]
MHLTPENRTRLRATVFGKTEAGRAEVAQRNAGLTARQRSVLILLDGQRALGEIDTWLGEDEMLESVEALLRKGLAGIASAPPAVARPAPPEPAPEAVPMAPLAAPPASPTLSAARELMAAAARKHLGLLAADLVRRIEQAKDEGQLAGIIGLWHVSLRESKTGKPCAEGLLEEARALLA